MIPTSFAETDQFTAPVSLRVSTTFFYAVFGLVLASDLEFPELRPAPPTAAPDWVLRVVDTPPTEAPVETLGQRQIGAERYTLSRTATGLRLDYSHGGAFDLSADGSRIVWYARDDVLLEHVRNIVIGPIAGLALELAGLLCLHGSGVVIDGGAVAFLGPKYFGKSTLAATLVAHGAQLIGDDLLAVAPGPPPLMRPGVPSVRLWSDMAALLPISDIGEKRIPGVKTTVTGLAAERVSAQSTPVRAIYLLSPMPRDAAGPPVRRTLLGRLDSTIALAHQTKLPDSLIGLRAAGTQLAAAAAVAANVPVWSLHTVRDVGRLNDLASQILNWSRSR